ncbi:MAG: hypothetical protein IKY67_13685 [Paludibacteraceae bacterium]|nr:hypothetical protein [Paludibacteraceae bacterium]
MAKLKSQAIRVVEIKEHEYLQLVENTIKLEALKIAGIEKMTIYKAMEHILNNQHIDILIKPLSRRYR